MTRTEMFSALLTSTSIVSELVHDAAGCRYYYLLLLLTYLSSSKKYDGKKEAKTLTSSFHLLISQKKQSGESEVKITVHFIPFDYDLILKEFAIMATTSNVHPVGIQHPKSDMCKIIFRDDYKNKDTVVLSMLR